MKNKILIVTMFALMFAFTSTVSAANNNTSGIQNQVSEKIQIANQGEESQVQNNTQVQNGTVNQAGINTGIQIQEQSQQKLQDRTETGNQVQNQNQVKNQGEANQVQNKEKESTQAKSENGSQVSEQRRSNVANAVQKMLQIVDKNGGIGQQVKTIAQTQTQNQEKLENGLQKVESRGVFAKFFVGPNYGEINNVKKLLEQNKEQIKQLNQIKTQLSNQGDIQILTEQIQTLGQSNLEIENSLNIAQKGFSLFGWLFK